MILRKKDRKLEIDTSEVKLLISSYNSSIDDDDYYCRRICLFKTYYVVDTDNDVELALNFRSSWADHLLAVFIREHSGDSGYSFESFLEKRIIEYISNNYFNANSLYQTISARHDNLEIHISSYEQGGFLYGVCLEHLFYNKKFNLDLHNLYEEGFGEIDIYDNEFVSYEAVTQDNLGLAVDLNSELPYGDSLNKIFNTLLLKPELSDNVFWNTQKIIRSSVAGSKSDVGYVKFNVVDS